MHTLRDICHTCKVICVVQADVQGAPAEALVGEAAVHVAGEAASRLLRGERVAVTVPLTTTSCTVRAHSATNVPVSAPLCTPSQTFGTGSKDNLQHIGLSMHVGQM